MAIKQGIYKADELSNEEYHKFDINQPTISISSLMEYRDNKNTWADKYIHDINIPKDIGVLNVGRYMHERLLEDKTPDWIYILPKEIERRSGKEYAEHVIKAGEKPIYKHSEIAEIDFAIETSLRRPALKKMLSLGEKEKSFYATCPKTGLLLKARPDISVETEDYIVIIDLKVVTYSVNVESIAKYHWEMFKRHYQAQFHRNVVQLATNKPVIEVIHICIDWKNKPFPWNLIKVPEHLMLEAGNNIDNLLTDMSDFLKNKTYSYIYEGLEPKWMEDNTSFILGLQ